MHPRPFATLALCSLALALFASLVHLINFLWIRLLVFAKHGYGHYEVVGQSSVGITAFLR